MSSSLCADEYSVADVAQPSVSVVIPVRNAERTLDAQLEALARQQFDAPWELVVVDNGSADGTRALLDVWSARLAHLRVVSEPRRGVNRARNTGIAASRADRILLCDGDDIVGEGWLAALSGALDDDDLAAGRLEYDMLNSADILRRTERRLLSDGLALSWGRPWAQSCNLGFHRTVFDALNGFDQNFARGGSDDMDFCLRAHAEGFTMGYAPEALVHYQLRGTAREHAKQLFYYARGTEHLYAKLRALGQLPEFPPRTRWNQSALRGVRLVLAIPECRSAEGRDRYMVRAAQFAGGLAGLWQYQLRPGLP
jgi:glycosyltransferase involved in cell wall biosynthesis